MQKFNLTNIVTKDLALKLHSLLLAVVLWYFVGGENRINKNVMIPIEIINLPRDLVISNQFKKEIEVTVNGPRSVILDMDKRSVTRQVDLSKATPGTMVIENDNDHIPVPRGVNVQRVQPASIILSLDKLISKQYPVTARTVGRVARDYYVKNVRTEPDVITITGPQTTLMQFDELFTKPINLEGVKQSAQIQVPLELEPAIVDLIGETSVTANFTIALETITKTIPDLKIDLEDDTRIAEPAVVQVTANIPKALLRKEKGDLKDLFVVTAIPQKEEDRFKVKVIPRLDLEVPVEILSIVPSTVAVKTVAGKVDHSGFQNKVPVIGPIPPLVLPGPDISGETKQENKENKENKKIPSIHSVKRIDREKEKRLVEEE